MLHERTPSQAVTGQRWIVVALYRVGVAKSLAAGIGVLLVLGVTAGWAIYHWAPAPDHPLADFLKRFDLGHEPSIPGFFSAVLILITGSLLFAIGRDARQRRDARWRYWYLLAMGFLVMAIDEAVMFHEMVNTAMCSIIPAVGVFYFAWVVPALIVVAAVAVLFASFVWSLPARTRKLFVLAATMYVGGAVGMEMVAGLIFDAAVSYEVAVGSPAHIVEQAVEEGLEMAGIAVFFVALLDLVGRQSAGFKLALEPTQGMDHA